jgi:hypothetical protein
VATSNSDRGQDRVPEQATQAPVITAADPRSFPRSVLAERHPALIRRMAAATPYPPTVRAALDRLLEEVTRGTIGPLPAGHRDLWPAAWGPVPEGRSWFDVPFLWAESYFYRRLLAVTGHFAPGPWQGVDPFAPFKQDELDSPAVDGELAALDALPDAAADRDRALLLAALWGNKADLGFLMAPGADPASAGTGPGGSPLVADDSARLWAMLPEGGDATVHLIADNAARELVADLVLLDHLVHTGRATRAVLHVKPHPYYVSDATTTDVLDGVRRLVRAPGHAGEAGARLHAALATGRIALRAHPFFCAPLPYEQMPDDLRAELASATVTVLKGDLNYRRLAGDRLWPPTTDFAARTAYFPSPVAALRTLKSDVVIGLDAATVEALDSRPGDAWRTSGRHALIQVRGA